VIQYPFNFQDKPNFSSEDFIISNANELALTYIEKWPNWGDHKFSKFLIVTGPSGSGKTHLAHIWQTKTNAEFLNIDQIENLISSDSNQITNFIIEDIEKNLNTEAEQKLFHLINYALDKNYYLLFTSNLPVNKIDLKLIDLKSRLNAMPAVSIAEPDEELLKTILIKSFSDKQIRINTDVINFILNRVERSFKEIQQLVEMLDKKSLAEKRNITIPLIKEIIGEQK
jgi:chromosomal replication initiation ATPase DnaA